jgi:CheY-like chemotaxis protein
MNTSLPLCFYPMRKIILDDDEYFTQSMFLKIDNINTLAFNSPKKALNHLLNEYQQTLSTVNLIDPELSDENTATQNTINIQIDNLKNMFHKNHYNDVSVILVDYHMPEMSGMDFLKKISHLPVKKMLITGEQDYQIAVNAFNDGLVDFFIRKDDPNFPHKVKDSIANLEWKYFTELSSIVYDLPQFSYLKNPHVFNFFKEFIKENNISAFCLIDTQGTFLAQTPNGQKKHILIRSYDQLKDLALVAKEDGATADVIRNLEKGTAIPFFNTQEYWQIPASEWDKYLYSATALHGDTNIVWTVIE